MLSFGNMLARKKTVHPLQSVQIDGLGQQIRVFATEPLHSGGAALGAEFFPLRRRSVKKTGQEKTSPRRQPGTDPARPVGSPFSWIFEGLESTSATLNRKNAGKPSFTNNPG